MKKKDVLFEEAEKLIGLIETEEKKFVVLAEKVFKSKANIDMLEAHFLKEISLERDEKNKPCFSNEVQRKSELSLRLSKDEDYRKQLNQLLDLEHKTKLSRIGFESSKRLFSLFRAAIEGI